VDFVPRQEADDEGNLESPSVLFWVTLARLHMCQKELGGVRGQGVSARKFTQRAAHAAALQQGHSYRTMRQVHKYLGILKCLGNHTRVFR
jgi:hypothetical protein